jgi:hypothetical protein
MPKATKPTKARASAAKKTKKKKVSPGSAKPAKAIKTSKAPKSLKSSKSSKSIKASKKTKTAKPAKVAKAAKPSKTAKAAKPVKIAKAAKPAKIAKVVKAAKPAKAAKASRSSKSAKATKQRRSGAEASLSSPGNPVIKDDGKGSASKRKLGLRGAAPWAARHAAKHAAEARARAAEPAPPGSARATIRIPDGAEAIKQKISDLHNQTQKIRTLRKRLDKGFFEIGQVLLEIQAQELYLAKGYGSFETFLEREIDLGKQTSLKLIKISQIFQQEPALDYGMDRLIAALSALDGESTAPKPSIPSSPGSKPMLPMKPPMRIVG